MPIATAQFTITDLNDIEVEDLKFNFTNIVGCSVVGNVVTKTGVDGWNSGFSNSYKFNNGDSLEFKVMSGIQMMIGFSNYEAGLAYNTIKYAWYVDTSKDVIYESGVIKKSFDRLTVTIYCIKINENKIWYYRDGLLEYTSDVIPTLPLILDASMYANGSSVALVHGVDGSSGAVIASLTAKYASVKSSVDGITTTVATNTDTINKTSGDLNLFKTTVASQFNQTSDSIQISLSKSVAAQKGVDANKADILKIGTYVKIVADETDPTLIHVILGDDANKLVLDICNNKLAFKIQGNEVAYMSDNKLYVTEAEILNNIKLGGFAIIPRTSGNLSFKYIGK